MSENNIIIIAGPTASGKTATSIKLSKEFDAEVVNFDSLLFYNELNIGTAKPTLAEQGHIPHYMIGTHSAKNPINAADYMKEAIPIINDIHQRGKTVVLVGGSGFYLQALLHGMYDSITTSDEIRSKSDQLYETQGIDPFLEILKKEDLKSYERYHENDHYRIRRACEHFWMTGKAFSKAREDMPSRESISPSFKYGWRIHFCYLDLPKEEHFKIIQQRTNQMLNDGLVEEVKNLLKMGFTGEEKPLKSIGYKEVIDYISGEFESLEACGERISISTRQLAKAQRTWFKKIEKNSYDPLSDQDKILADCLKFIRG